ncbi:TetR/AcrR family transcriptional regulator [Amycolatopsis sp. NPDC021455]|uniref:TetR/AcrR family transcriptional regulator n=1 Tax=Amycolatopsis sp. NPDC021455 TaxID=3154901 RepID=UPI0033F78ABD
MPKRVDHDQRRREIVAALWRIASTGGLEAVSLGEVAVEAGVSKGMVQHYFGSKQEMLRYATGYLRARVEQRISPQPPTLRGLLLALLPVDEDSRTESLVANAFFFRALNDPALAARFREGNTMLRDTLAARITDEIPALDPTEEADTLLALLSGLTNALLLGHHNAAAATALLDHHLVRIGAHRNSPP